MPAFLIIRYIAGVIVFLAVGGTAYLVNDFTGAIIPTSKKLTKNGKKDELALKVKSEKIILADNAPGEKALLKAQRLLAEGSMSAAEEKLKYVSSYYPTAESAARARKILGEINLDRLLDPSIKEGKKEITVQRGDTYSRIVVKNKTTMDSLVHFSGLKSASSRSLHPGDKLTVMPLNMHAVINVRRKLLTIFNGDDYVKEYPILESTYKGASSAELKITSIRGIKKGKSFPSHVDGYLTSDKIIKLSDKSLVIRSDAEPSEGSFSFGFTLSYADMAELPLLLRPGNDIKIKR